MPFPGCLIRSRKRQFRAIQEQLLHGMTTVITETPPPPPPPPLVQRSGWLGGGDGGPQTTKTIPQPLKQPWAKRPLTAQAKARRRSADLLIGSPPASTYVHPPKPAPFPPLQMYCQVNGCFGHLPFFQYSQYRRTSRPVGEDRGIHLFFLVGVNGSGLFFGGYVLAKGRSRRSFVSRRGA